MHFSTQLLTSTVPITATNFGSKCGAQPDLPPARGHCELRGGPGPVTNVTSNSLRAKREGCNRRVLRPSPAGLKGLTFGFHCASVPAVANDAFQLWYGRLVDRKR